uniref:Reverse transcriptase domain-containing protein n=1 Tax=Tanacetum cinerariifolium TaxID=118510 RepID=A0A6L2KH44_TANCI|nr:reverse transcriptase domain-containing protein [Tanacetum cinerariifolium]
MEKTKQRQQKGGNLKKGNTTGEEHGTEGPMIIEAEMGGHFVHRICHKPDDPWLPTTTPLVKFKGEMIWPLGQISLLAKIGDEKRSTSTWMNFMIKPTYMTGVPRHIAEHSLNIRGGCPPVRQKKKGQAPERNKTIYEEVENLVDAGIMKEVHYHRKPADMTGVSHHIEEHSIIIREGCPPIRQKKMGQASERNKAIYEEVEKLVDAGIMKEVHYQSWLSNPVMVRIEQKMAKKQSKPDKIKHEIERLHQKRSNRRRVPNIVEPEIRTIEEIVSMAGRTMKSYSRHLQKSGNLLNKTTREALKIIENKSKVRYSRSKSNVSRVNTNSRDNVSKTDDRVDKLADQISNLVEIVNKQVITPATAKAVEKTCVTCRGAHAYYDCIATDSNQPSVCAATRSYNQASTSGTLSSNIVPNSKGEMKAVTTRSGLAYEGPSIHTNSPLEEVVEQNTEEITDKEHSNCPGSTAQVQPPVVPISIPEPDVPRTQSKPTIPYPSRLNDQKLREKATNQMEKFFQIFHDLHFDISFADAFLLMPKFASTIKSLLTNKDKLFELAKVPLNENCSAMLIKKLPEKLGDPGKFLIPCDFPGMDVCHALADLGASINLTPLSIWKKVSLPELTPTWMTLELADRSITRPKGGTEDVFVKVGKFHFPTNFVVVDFEADPRVPLILGRYLLRTGRALIDVYGEEITLRVNDESITFNLNQTMRYSSTYDDNSVNRVVVIDIACEEFVHDVLDFHYNPKSSNPTLVSDPTISESDFSKDPIVKSSSPTLTPFGESDFFLEEIKDFLNDDSIPTGIENSVYDPEGDILFLEKLLNEDPIQLPPIDLKLAEETKAKSSVEEPPELELKELPSHLEYAFLQESNKLPVIIAKDLKDVKKEALIKVLKSHKRAIAWKISDIKGIDPRFCTYKILMEDNYKPAVQSQRRVNPKIHDVIKKEVIKLLDAGMIYPIFDSPWVSPIYCVPKKGGMTVVANENNELIPMRLVTGWRVCIDYRKLNDATRKDHFPLPFMDQMLE